MNYTTSAGLEKQGWSSQRVCMGHNFMKVAFLLQQKLALEEGSIASPDIHQQSDAMNSIMERLS
jgi:hypothetical protein